MHFAAISDFRSSVSRLLPSGLLLAFAASAACLAGAQTPSLHLSPGAAKEVQTIYAFKASFTPAEQKMSSSLVLISRAAAGQPLGKMAKFYIAPQRDSNGQILIEVEGFASPSLLKSSAIGSVDAVNGAAPVANYKHARLMAHVRANKLAELAAQPDVKSLREPSPGSTNVGSVTSQGYVAMGANKVVPTGVNGSGIKVGVLSDSASPARVAALIASGDLPPDTVVVPGQVGPSAGEDEGTAMMEIVHDVAPGAKLFFATADSGQDSFAANIRTLRFVYGCDIIVDDFSYFAEYVFQDGTVAQAVNDVTADGALYFSSAANSGNLDSGTSGTWEGDFNPSGVVFTTDKGSNLPLNSFGGNFYDTLTSVANSGVWTQWSDPAGASNNDYDLFIFDSTFSTVKCASVSVQNGSQDPLEFCYPGYNYTGAAAGDQIVFALASGAQRAIHVDTERATLSLGTSGATFGHNAAAKTFTAAAVYWNAARTGTRPFTGGPSNPVEPFSSDGPRKIFYNPDGTAITPGNLLFSTGGGTTLQKPDGAGADGVSTATPGFLPFFGTSAAAPHEAAVAALVKSANPGLTNVQIRTILDNTALDNMAPGVDRDSGYGILWAPAAVAAAKAMLP